MRVLQFICLLSLLALALLPACRQAKDKGEADEGAAVNPRVPVKVSVVKKGTMEDALVVPGLYDLLKKERILAPVAGRVIAVEVREGQLVKAHDVVARLHTREADAALTGAREMLRLAATDQEKETAGHAVELAASAAKEIVLRAGTDGIIASRSAMEGELIAEQGEVVTIVDPSSLVFIADVPAGEVGKIHPGMAAEVAPLQGTRKPAKALVDAFYPSTDATSQTTKVRLRLNDVVAGARAGEAGTARILMASRHDVLLVPESALIHDDETDIWSLVIVESDSLSRHVPVVAGGSRDSLREVVSPLLRAGTLVVTEGNYTLPDSAHVVVDQ
jgi:multidrug efflux pump subunit AcrA (membrane-fusion protein)